MTNDTLRRILKSRLHASLAMLKDAIEKCPDDVWLDDRFTNRYWQLAYHVLFYTYLYLHNPNPENHLDCRARPPRMSSTLTRCRHPGSDAGNRTSFAGLRLFTDTRDSDLKTGWSGIARAIRLTRHGFATSL